MQPSPSKNYHQLMATLVLLVLLLPPFLLPVANFVMIPRCVYHFHGREKYVRGKVIRHLSR